jgi:hypothetical protein
MKNRGNGWKRALQRQIDGKLPKFMVKVTEFETVIHEAGVGVEDSSKNPKVREWIVKNYARRYVPVKVLEEMGISTEKISISAR